MSIRTPPANAPQLDPPPHALPPFHQLLQRPPDQRRREYQYRFAQSVVFGLPVLALQRYGPSLGGPESGRWVAVLQALLAGWVIYVGAAGMLFEGLVWLVRRRFSADLAPAATAVGLYLLTLVRLATGRSPWFHWVVLIVAVWTGLCWWRLARWSNTPR